MRPHTEGPDEGTPWRQTADWRPLGARGRGAGREDLAGAGVSVGGRENVLELDRGG